jgi:hypothetical protein
MKEREKIIISGLVVFMLFIWLGFLFHDDPTFPGSSMGLLFGIAGAALMFVPLLYLFIKRIKPLKRLSKKYLSMRTLLTWHIYAGVLGPILVVVHTGHRFESPVGIALTAMTLVVVLSGFTGRYLMSFIGREIREKKDALKALRTEYGLLIGKLQNQGHTGALVHPGLARAFLLRLSVSLIEQGPPSTELRAIRLVESIADVEYALRTHNSFKLVFSKWLKLHIVISIILYLLLALHVYSQFYFGLRWLS